MTHPPFKYIGTPQRRKEDFRLLTGQGDFIHGLEQDGALHAAMLRSPHAHARILKIDAERAMRAPGVAFVLTGEQLKSWTNPVPTWFAMLGGKAIPINDYPVAVGKVRFVGEPVAVALAENRYAAEDALELIDVHYDPLPAVVDADKAMPKDAPLLFDEAGTNVLWHKVFRWGDVRQAFAAADLILKEDFYFHRYSSVPLETYGIMASYDSGHDVLTIAYNCQSPHMEFNVIAGTLGLPHSKLRVVTPGEMGGGFGIKNAMYPYAIIIGLLSMKARRPVKWVEDRLEHLAASRHGSEKTFDVEFAVRKDGRVLGFRFKMLDNEGAYIRRPEPVGAILWCQAVQGCYQIRDVEMDCSAVVTNKCPVTSNRGYGRQPHLFVIERMMDIIARELNIDPAEVRRRNFIGPDQFPYETTNGCVYDSGNYSACLEKALELLEYDGWREKQRQGWSQGRYIGIGLASIVEPGASNVTAWGLIDPEVHISSQGEAASISIDRFGTLRVRLGALGQSYDTIASQILAEEFGLPLERIQVAAGIDTWTHPASATSGVYASRFAPMVSGALQGAAKRLKEKLVLIVSGFWRVDPQLLEFQDGAAVTKNDPSKQMSLNEIVDLCYLHTAMLPEGVDPTLDVTYVYNYPLANEIDANQRANFAATYANAMHAAVVEVDVETGEHRVLKYVVVSDCGTMINPMVVDGQIHGIVAHGLGAATTEEFVYDPEGQLLTPTLLEYSCPQASDIPEIIVDHLVTPSPFSAYGVKGMGEGSNPVPAVIAGAVEDALRPFAVRVRRSRITPEFVLGLIQEREKPGQS